MIKVERVLGIVTGGVGAMVGAEIGSHMGIVGYGHGMNGSTPFAIGCGSVGYIVGSEIGKQIDTHIQKKKDNKNNTDSIYTPVYKYTTPVFIPTTNLIPLVITCPSF